jgi:DNA-binding response OmpR family regulator
VPSIVILDLPSQGDATSQLVAEVRSRFPNSRLLTLVDSLAVPVSGADETLTRPWNRQQLLSAVRRLCLTARPLRPTKSSSNAYLE